MTEPIPKEVLEEARLKAKRRLAASMMSALAESNMSLDVAMKRLGKDAAYWHNFIAELSNGTYSDMDPYIDMFTALGEEPLFGSRSLSRVKATDNE